MQNTEPQSIFECVKFLKVNSQKTKETGVGMGGITSRGANGQLEVGYEWRKPL
jgi:hypothetical protein